MTSLHLQTETGHQTASILRQNASMASEELQTLRRVIQSLEMGWQGNAQMEFSAECTSTLGQLQHQIMALRILSERLEHEVSEWEQVDQAGAMSMRSHSLGLLSAQPMQTVPITAGRGSAASYLVPILPLTTALAIGSFFRSIPNWFSSFMDRFFESPSIVSPLPNDTGTLVTDDHISSQPTSGFGELLNESPADTPPTEPTIKPSNNDQDYAVPTKSQGDLYGNAACAPTSVSMVLDYYHAQNPDLKTASPSDLIGMLDQGDGTPGSGIGLHRLNDDLKELGYNNIVVEANADFGDLDAALNDGPVIVTAGVKLIGGQARDIQQAGNSIHAMVVKGINAESVIVNDPWSGVEKVFSRNTFSTMWAKGSNGMYVIRP